MKYGNQLNYGLAALAVIVALLAVSKTLFSPLDVETVLLEGGDSPVSVRPPEEGQDPSLSLNPRPRPGPALAGTVRAPGASLPASSGERSPALTPETSGGAPTGSGSEPRVVQPASPDGPPGLPLNLSGAAKRRSDPPAQRRPRRPGSASRDRAGQSSGITRPPRGAPSQSQSRGLPDRSGERTRPAPPPTRSSNQ